MPLTLRQRLFRGIGANVFGNFASVLIQLVTVPALLHAWGSGLYGAWLVLAAIPGYLALSDLGFANVAGNEMTVLVARNQEDSARAVFQSAWIFITLASCLIA